MTFLTVALFNMQMYLIMVAFRSPLLYSLLTKSLTSAVKSMFFCLVQHCVTPLPSSTSRTKTLQRSPQAPECEAIIKTQGLRLKSIWQEKAKQLNEEAAGPVLSVPTDTSSSAEAQAQLTRPPEDNQVGFSC